MLQVEESGADSDLPLAPLEPRPARPSLRRRLLQGTLWSTVGRIASMGSLILGNMILARAWASEDAKGDFAAYAIAAAAAVLLGFPATMGAPKILTRVIREGIHTHQLALLRARLRSANWLMLLSCAGIAALMVLGINVLNGAGALRDAIKWRALIDHSALVAAWMCLSALCQAASQGLMGFDDFRTAALVGARSGGVIANIGFLAAALAAWGVGHLTLAVALWTQVAVNALALAVGAYFLRRAITDHLGPESENESETFSAGEANVAWFFRESWPNLVIQLTTMGILPIELLLISMMADESEIADYRAVQNLEEVLVAAQTLATTIVGPFVSELFAKQQLAKLQMLLRGSATLIAIPTLAVLAVYLAFPELSLRLTFGPEYVGGAWPLRITAGGAAVACLTGLNGLTMVMTGRQRELLRASVLASLIYLVLAPLLIYQFRTIGAALAITLVFGIYNTVVTRMVHERIGVWTTASLSPAYLREAFRILRRRPQGI